MKVVLILYYLGVVEGWQGFWKNPRFTRGAMINFRDPAYSAEDGGYHPVEIALNGVGRLYYITDFAYVGTGGCAELVKELDFDFDIGLFQQFAMEYPIATGRMLYQIWENNFISYYEMGVYQVSLKAL